MLKDFPLDSADVETIKSKVERGAIAGWSTRACSRCQMYNLEKRTRAAARDQPSNSTPGCDMP